MIVYHDILKRLAEKGWSTYRLQKEGKLSNGVIINIRAGRSITMNTLDTICCLCECQPGELISYTLDDSTGEE